MQNTVLKTLYIHIIIATWNEACSQHFQAHDYHCCTHAASVKSCTQCYQAHPMMLLASI